MHISIAIPDSCLSDETTQLDKTRKISLIARACAIFRTDTIYIYDDNGSQSDKILLATILKYLDTPPFLRKRLFPKVNELKYAGVLHPLKIPSHVTPSNPKTVKDNDVREGIIFASKGKKFVDIGINQPLNYFGKKEVGKRTTIKFKKGFPNFEFKEIEKNEIQEYWGYQIRERSKLFSLISEWRGKIILTSRKAKIITKPQIEEYQKTDAPVLIVFGTVDKGIHEILGNKIKNVQNGRILNFFPNQATETVRLEEAILGTLSIINLK